MSFVLRHLYKSVTSPKNKRALKLSILGATSGGCLGAYYAQREGYIDVNSVALVRLLRAGTTVGLISYTYKTKLYSSKLSQDSEEFAQLRSKVHDEAAKMLLELCCQNRGVYIKIGQHIGALDYLVPPEYTKVLSVLHSDAPQSSFKDIKKVLEKNLKKDISEIFYWIDEKPIGAASLAQVHKAQLLDGTDVCVKVQYPYVFQNAISDMKTMEFLFNVISFLFEDFKFQWLVDETKKNLPKELDFIHEGENGDKVREKFSSLKWLKIPKVFWDLTTSRVITMEYYTGGKVNDLQYIEKQNINKIEVIEKLTEVYAHMIFKHGLVHSDPHPGNILIRKDQNQNLDIILLDHGLYAELSEEFRYRFAQLYLSILTVDKKGMEEHSTKLGVTKELYPLFVCMITGRTWDSVTRGVYFQRYSLKEKQEFQQYAPQLFGKIIEILDEVHSEMLLLLKTSDLLRGLEHTLKTEKQRTAFVVMSKGVVDAIYEWKSHETNNHFIRFQNVLRKTFICYAINAMYFYHSCKNQLCSFVSWSRSVMKRWKDPHVPGVLAVVQVSA